MSIHYIHFSSLKIVSKVCFEFMVFVKLLISMIQFTPVFSNITWKYKCKNSDCTQDMDTFRLPFNAVLIKMSHKSKTLILKINIDPHIVLIFRYDVDV